MRAIRVFITVMILSFLFSGVVSARSYSDVPIRYKHFDAISALSEDGVVKGYANGEFHPDGLINRAEAVKILIETHYDDSTITQSLNEHKSKNHWYILFKDVKMGEWFGSYVKVAHQNTIVEGYPDGLFKPGNNINFAEALKIILESYNVELSQTQFKHNKLIYVKNGEWFEKYFTYAFDKNLINQNKFYHPAQLITRGEFVEIMHRTKTILQTGLPEYIAPSHPNSDEYTITIPTLNIINLPVYFADPYNEQAALDVLKKGLGHYLEPPSSGKKTVVFGHSSGFSWDNSPYKTILNQINKLHNGDKIFLNYKERGYAYEIFKSNIIPATEDYKIIENPKVNELALYTCWPPNSIKQRYVVYGKPLT